ncbi:hypothetical protein [Kribbella sp. NPDC051137]|uniref:hypothetical protein n=1 Tax=Kribbella sp. NPDC051137 TaxID=3155045 RepID=UPI00344573D0
MSAQTIPNGPPGDSWVSPSCTLPTVEQPLRVAEFDDLLGTALRGIERPAPTLPWIATG